MKKVTLFRAGIMLLGSLAIQCAIAGNNFGFSYDGYERTPKVHQTHEQINQIAFWNPWQ